MESIHLFLEEVTTELLYNIVYDHDEIDYRSLSEIFEEKTGYRPMDFFGFGNKTGDGWFEFIEGIPGVEGRIKISIVNDQYYKYSNYKDGYVYKVFNKTRLASKITVAENRMIILIRCCKMLGNVHNLNRCKDSNGNTPLHYIAALPGLTYDCDTLVKYLLQAGVDPLTTNKNGQTFLHIIFGRFLVFINARVPKTQWFIEDTVKLLKLLSQNLSSTYTALLAKAQDKNGNTVLHEYLLSTTVEELNAEKKICKNLLQFGACLTIPNKSNEVPLHYAYTPELFKIFLQNGAVCRRKNDRDESPVLFILKKSVVLAFAETSAIVELVDQAFVKTDLNRSVPGAIELLKNLKNIISQNEEAKKTAWIPDVKGNIAVSVLLVAIRIGYYGLGTKPSKNKELCSAMVELLSEMLRNASPSDMKWANKNGQSFLHVLLDMRDENEYTMSKEYVCQSIAILLKHGADVNAVDSQRQTPLDITYKYRNKLPLLHTNCTELLIRHGATGQHDARNNSSSSSATNSLDWIHRRFFNLSVRSETRKLRSCPKRHLGNAERLTDPRTQVTIVEKYRYSSQNLIGSGAFSSIFVAIKDENVDSKSGRIECRAFALKRIEKARMNSKDIKREITTLMSISDKCEHIIKCHESFEDDNFQYLCLDLMDGDLHEFVTNKEVNKVLKSNPASGVQVTKELVDGLAFLHKEKFIHRDLKPGNILYTTDPKLHFKIADFGLTKDTAGSSMISSTGGSGVAMAAGTRCWMAPELVSMKTRDHTKQSDIFSLGLVFHYLLTLGKHPFGIEGEPAHVIERKIVEMPPKLGQTLGSEVTSFLQILLRKNPSKRPPAAFLNQHPFLWSDRKKIEFLKAVGDQPEAANPTMNPNSELERRLQTTNTGQRILTWDRLIVEIYHEMIRAWRQKKYRTDKVIDLIRFIRNAYAHKQDRSLQFQQHLDDNIFTRKFPSLVLDVFDVVQQLENVEERSNICEALNLST